MSDTAVQILLLVAGGALGLLLALFVQPLLKDKAEVVLVRALGKFWVRRHGGLAGPWRFVWTKDPAQLDRSEEVSLRLAEVGSRVSGRFSWRGREYWLLGRRETQSYVSGTYIDQQAGNTFHGAFQLRIYPNEERMRGRWMGFNASDVIVEGPWEWRREKTATYPYEFDGAPGGAERGAVAKATGSASGEDDERSRRSGGR